MDTQQTALAGPAGAVDARPARKRGRPRAQEGAPLAKYAPALGLTDERREIAVAQMQQTGIFADAAAAVGVSISALSYWRSEHPDFEAELQAARRNVEVRAGQKAVHALEAHLEAVLNGERLEDRYAPVPGKPGERVLVQRGDKIPLNVNAARTLITAYRPELTHPKTEVEHSGTVTVAAAVKAARERMALPDDSNVIDSTAEPVE